MAGRDDKFGIRSRTTRNFFGQVGCAQDQRGRVPFQFDTFLIRFGYVFVTFGLCMFRFGQLCFHLDAHVFISDNFVSTLLRMFFISDNFCSWLLPSRNPELRHSGHLPRRNPELRLRPPAPPQSRASSPAIRPAAVPGFVSGHQPRHNPEQQSRSVTPSPAGRLGRRKWGGRKRGLVEEDGGEKEGEGGGNDCVLTGFRSAFVFQPAHEKLFATTTTATSTTTTTTRYYSPHTTTPHGALTQYSSLAARPPIPYLPCSPLPYSTQPFIPCHPLLALAPALALRSPNTRYTFLPYLCVCCVCV